MRKISIEYFLFSYDFVQFAQQTQEEVLSMEFAFFRLIVTGEFIFSSSYDKTIKAWVFDTTTIGPGQESESCIRTFKGHGKGVYPLIFIPAEDFDLSDGATFNPGDTIISGSADQTARTWSCDTGACLKVRIVIIQCVPGKFCCGQMWMECNSLCTVHLSPR